MTSYVIMPARELPVPRQSGSNSFLFASYAVLKDMPVTGCLCSLDSVPAAIAGVAEVRHHSPN
jgi:hypothetical protein